ncbi:MAG TPA: hypothetical protein VEX86_20145 [Longimicrobium sp.]|nr:hypothetical protein [Longimicrobium sp.]
MQKLKLKLKLDVDELAVESFGVAVEDEVGTVLANIAPTAQTRECPCIALTSPHVCG